MPRLTPFRLMVVILGVVAAGAGTAVSAPATRGMAPASAALCFSRPSTGSWGRVTKGRFAVWYRTPAAKPSATIVLNALNAAKTTFGFMLPALSDINADCGNGGTRDQLDFYLVPGLKLAFKKVDGHTYPLEIAGVSGVTAFTEIEESLTGKNLPCTAVHEYFHHLQQRYLGEVHPRNYWWTEGTADWAEFHFDPLCPRPLKKANEFQQKYSRDELVKIADPYTPWLWPLWLEKKAGSTNAIKRVFEKMEAGGGGDFPAAEALPASTWRSELPRFGLREFNLANVDEFTAWQATGSQAKLDVSDMSLFRTATHHDDRFTVKVEPGAVVLALVSVLDEETRDLLLDVRDFTRQSRDGAALRVLLQPTMGPNPVATRNDWTKATEEDWSKLRTKKYFCRDVPDDDYQQVLLAFANTEPLGHTIQADIKLESNAICPWRVSADVIETGAPPAEKHGDTASGSLRRQLHWTLQPVDEAVTCPTPNRVCLPLTGRLADSVNWSATSNTSDALPESHATTTVTAAGSRTSLFVEGPGATDFPNPVITQDTTWDAARKRFRSNLNVTLIDSLIRNGIELQRTPARAQWASSGGGFCGVEEPDYVYTGSNKQGLVTQTWTSCMAEDDDYGATGPLFFEPLAFPAGTRLTTSRPDDGPCGDVSLIQPWTAFGFGLCFALKPDPSQTPDRHELTFTATTTPPTAYGAKPYPDPDYCTRVDVPCIVDSYDLGSDFAKWSMTYQVAITLTLVPRR